MGVVLRSPLPGDVAFAWAGEEDLPRLTLLPAERALLSGRATETRVREFTLGRGCAREALAELDATAAGEPLLRRDTRMPRWPGDVVGTITHKGGYGAAAVAPASRYRGVGLDLEQIRPPTQALLQRILRPEERAALTGLPSSDLAPGFTLVFSAKESLFKALNPYTGVFLGFQDAVLSLAPGSWTRQAGGFAWKLHKGCGPEFPAGTTGEGGFTREGAFVLTGVWVPTVGTQAADDEATDR